MFVSINRKLSKTVKLITSNLPPIVHRFQVMVQFSLANRECLSLTFSLGMISCQYRRKRYIAKIDYLAYISAAESTDVSPTTFT